MTPSPTPCSLEQSSNNPQLLLLLTDRLQCLSWLHAERVHPTLQACTRADLDDIRRVNTNVEAQHKRNSWTQKQQQGKEAAVQGVAAVSEWARGVNTSVQTGHKRNSLDTATTAAVTRHSGKTEYGGKVRNKSASAALQLPRSVPHKHLNHTSNHCSVPNMYVICCEQNTAVPVVLSLSFCLHFDTRPCSASRRSAASSPAS